VVDRSVTLAAGEEDFVTALFAEFDPRGWLELVTCGHPPPLRLTADGGLQALVPAAYATPLGLHPDMKTSAFAVGEGDRLVFYTDGLLEARDRAAGTSAWRTISTRFAGPIWTPPRASCWTASWTIRAAGSATTWRCCCSKPRPRRPVSRTDVLRRAEQPRRRARWAGHPVTSAGAGNGFGDGGGVSVLPAAGAGRTRRSDRLQRATGGRAA